MTPAAEATRLLAIDAARGIAMLFVCVSHFGWVYFRGMPDHDAEFKLLGYVTMLASPTFVMVSGLLLGFLYRRRPELMPALKAKLIDRALFMLTIGHVLLDLAHVPVAGGFRPALAWGFITDVIALGLLVGPVVVERVPPRPRLLVAGAAYVLTWVAVGAWRPQTAVLERLKEYVFGPALFIPESPRLVPDCFPLLPWLAIYIAATVLGEHLGATGIARRSAPATATLTRLSLACLGGALTAKGVPFVLTSLGIMSSSLLVWALGWPFQKQPPSPAYLGVYAGLGLLLLRGTLAIDASPALRRWLMVPAALGRASLVAFIAQYFLYFTVIAWWDPVFSPLWPLLLVITVAVVVAVGLLWARLGNNDLLSIGYRRFTAPQLASRSAPGPAR